MTDIKSMTMEELTHTLREMGQPAFRGGQVFTWLHRGVTSFEEMSDLPRGLREQLAGLKASLDQAAHRAEETGRDLQKAQYELDVAREQQQNAAQQVLALETRGQHYDSLRETLEAALEEKMDRWVYLTDLKERIDAQ